MARYTYQYQRRDFANGCAALARRSPRRRIIEIVIWFALVLGLCMLMDRSGNPTMVVRAILLGYLPWQMYAGIAVFCVILWFRHLFFGWVVCAPIFSRNALANQEVYLDIDETGLQGGGTDMNTHIGWGAVKRVIETPDIIVFAVSAREGVLLPRRALPDAAAYDALMALAQRKLGAAAA